MPPYPHAIARLLALADFERKSRADQPPDWHLKRVQRLMQLLGDPHLAKPVVHVAGSKGKGSTSAFIASALTANGFRTGHYTSPHLHRFTERIAVDGTPIDESHFAGLVDELWHCVKAIDALGDIGTVSVFELLTAMAFVHFRDRADVDISIIEVGLGGRLDATNVVQPVVSVITPISLDHVAVLGDTIAAIAAEKAGIIKPGVPVVMSKQAPEAAAVIEQRARQVGSQLRQGDNALIVTHLPMLGAHQMDNARTAMATLQVLHDSGFPMNREAIDRGLAQTKWHCRTELVSTKSDVPVMLDGAHNNASAAALASTIAEHPKLNSRRIVLVLGATAGHDIQAVMHELLAVSPTHIIATTSRHPKSLPAEIVRNATHQAGFASVTSQPTVAAAIEQAERIVRDGAADMIITTGSLFVAAEAREHILGIEPELYDDIPNGYMHTYQ